MALRKTLVEKLEAMIVRYDNLAQSLSDPKVIGDQNRFRDLSKEHAQLQPIIFCFQKYQEVRISVEEAEAMQEDADAEMQALAAEELKALIGRSNELEVQLKTLLLPKDPNDERGVYLEIRAGTGGDEAAMFAGDLLRMYSRYAEKRRWKFEILTQHQGEHGGFKEVISRVLGADVYGALKFESGVHRVQRVPETESQGRVHTSACTVAVMPEVDAIEEVEINPSDLRIQTFRSSGAGGQHVNVTDSAVRIIHEPSGVVVECQDERSQHKNKAKAMALLQAKLLAEERRKQHQEQAQTRRSLIGSGDRSERIRTYNFPQGRVTDHRINLTLYKLDEMLEGGLDHVIEPLVREHQADLLVAVGE